MSSLGDFEIAQDINQSIRDIVRAEIARQRPAPRYGYVNSIDAESMSCMVTFIGEDIPVRVVYNNIAPTLVGQHVRVEGVPGDRYISSVRGTSQTEYQANEAQSQAESALNEANNASSQASIRAGRPLTDGLDAGGEASWDYRLVTPQSVTSVNGKWMYLRATAASEKRSIMFNAQYSATSTGQLYLDLYHLEGANWVKIIGSPNLSAQLLVNTKTSVVWSFPAGVVTIPGDLYAVQFSVIGSNIDVWGYPMGINDIPVAPGVIPQTVGAWRDTSTNRAPDSIPYSTINANRSNTAIFFELGSTQTDDQIPPRTWVENFNSGSWQYWSRSSSTANQYTIAEGRATYGGSTDGSQTALYVNQVSTDSMRIEFDVYNSRAQGARVYIASNSGLTNCVRVEVCSDHVEMQRCVNGTFTQVGNTVYTNGDGHYILDYTQEDNTYRLYKNSITSSAALVWQDSSNLITHGPGQRYAAIGAYRSAFFQSGQIDNFIFKDIVATV